jgi:hypothetical protein
MFKIRATAHYPRFSSETAEAVETIYEMSLPIVKTKKARTVDYSCETILTERFEYCVWSLLSDSELSHKCTCNGHKDTGFGQKKIIILVFEIQRNFNTDKTQKCYMRVSSSLVGHGYVEEQLFFSKSTGDLIHVQSFSYFGNNFLLFNQNVFLHAQS